VEGRLNILYRGPLSSCNYRCHYCPFAKRRESAAELRHDKTCLQRFENWVENYDTKTLGVLLTPWGEALTRSWYRDSMIRMSHLPHVQRVAVQTNLSNRLDWLSDANRASIALWCTYHPDEVSRSEFVSQCQQLDELGIRHSVGVVGLKEHQEEIEALRDELSSETYLWINAFKRDPEYYDSELIDQFTQIDPLFPVNNQRHPSFGKPCNTGHSVISVDGMGDIRRCHFIKDVIGNLYSSDLAQILKPRDCSNQTCGCHIGYVHMPHLKMESVFGDSLLERIPNETDAIGGKLVSLS